MQKPLRIIGILVVVLILTASLSVWFFNTKTPQAVEHEQNTPYEHAMNEKKPFVMMFHSNWCTYCHQVMPIFQKLSNEYQGKYNFVLLNVDEPNMDYVVQDYMPASIPMVYIVDPSVDNRILLNTILFNYPEKLRAELDRYLRIKARIK